jgi:hypothetical protein
MVPDRHLVHV